MECSVHIGQCCSQGSEHPVYLLELLKYMWSPWVVWLSVQQLGQSTAVVPGFESSAAVLVVQAAGTLAA